MTGRTLTSMLLPGLFLTLLPFTGGCFVRPIVPGPMVATAPAPQPVYYNPAPVYVSSPPVYYQPAPRVVSYRPAPRPVYYGPAPAPRPGYYRPGPAPAPRPGYYRPGPPPRGHVHVTVRPHR